MGRGNLPDPVEPMLHTMSNGQTVIRYFGKDKAGKKGVRNYHLGSVSEDEAERRLITFKREHKAMQENTGKKNGHAKKPGKAKRTELHTAGALVVIPEDKTAEHREASNRYYARRKEEAEKGRVRGEALRHINEHVGILAANLEVAARTLKMIQASIAELELSDD